ncbi:hypothetical protein JCM10908_002101 [Rhodotorula pacifica]|uniref:N-acetylglucosaminyldiphosphodolichol N-acetylglucosaminyltransferase catalytic subunit ALG13 n=1 Tax=Rhodotorula pacifica TaxID=1495444 RepID=UPI00318295EA
MGKTCILTVGSTRFDPLVHSFLSPDSLDALPALGVSTVVAQVGNSTLPDGYTLGSTTLSEGLQLRIVRFADDLEEQVGRADMVVSHAGAGSILSFLRPLSNSTRSTVSNRTLVLVPNSTLMDSHQSDLAEEMDKKGWATICWKTEDLPAALLKLASHAETPRSAADNAFPKVDEGKVQRILDEVLDYA